MKRRNFLAAPLAGLAWLVGIRVAKPAISEKSRVAPVEPKMMEFSLPNGDWELSSVILRLRTIFGDDTPVGRWQIDRCLFSGKVTLVLIPVLPPHRSDLAKKAPEA